MKTIYVDLDGVLADFGKMIKVKLGKTEDDYVNSAEFWKAVSSIDDFYYKLDLMPGAVKMMNDLKRIPDYKIEILTAIPKPSRGLVNAERDKRAWVKKYFGNIPVNVVVGGKTKAKYVKSKNDILIDDLKDNIDAWNSAGGTGIIYDNAYSVLLRVLTITK